MRTWTRKTWLGVVLAIVVIAGASYAVIEWTSGTRWAGAVVRVSSEESLENALATAEPGTTILLPDDLGPLAQGVIVSTPNVRLAAAGDRAQLSALGEHPVVSVAAEGVRLENLEISGASIGISVDGEACTLVDVSIHSTPIGIRLVNARRSSLEHVSISDGRIGIEMASCVGSQLVDVGLRNLSEVGIRLSESRNNVLEGLRVQDAAVGVSIEADSSDNVLRDCHVSGCTTAGIELRRSTDNQVQTCRVEASRIGIVLDTATGSELLDCEVRDAELSGIFVQQALQNRIVNASIKSAETGILFSQTAESAVLFSHIETCSEGIHLTNSDSNLVSENELVGCGVGIYALQDEGNQLMRNTISQSTTAGLFLEMSAESRVLDNMIDQSSWGIVLSESSHVMLLRNRLRHHTLAGLLQSGGGSDRVSENLVEECRVGIVALDADRNEILQNRLQENETGLLLIRSGSGVRIEGNVVADNGVGIHTADAMPTLLEEAAALLGLEMGAATSPTVAPVLANNHFLGNESFDLRNDAAVELLAAGNWWGEDPARTGADDAIVSDGVDLAGSSWRGTVAIGTEDDLLQRLLGRIMQYALMDAGLRVIDLVGMGTSERVWNALAANDVDAIWWESEANEVGQTSGTTTLPTSIAKQWCVVGSSRLIERLSDHTLSALSALASTSGDSFRIVVPASLSSSTVRAWLQAYGLDGSIQSQIATDTIEEAEALLKFGTVDLALVDSLEETLTYAGFSEIEDDQQVLPSQPIDAVIRDSLLERTPRVDAIYRSLSEALSTSVIHDLISRIRLLHNTPEDIAREYVSNLDVHTE